MIFFDIETVKHIPEAYKEAEDIAALSEKYGNDFNFMPEFNRIITITVGMFVTNDKKERVMTVKNLEGDEKAQIEKFFEITVEHSVCGWNCKGFDLPFIVRRALKYGIAIPNTLKLHGRKPWDVTNVLDLKDVYKHMGYRAASLGEVCVFLWIPTPKDAMDGSEVQKYHDEGKDAEILHYCKKDVEATMRVFDAFTDLNLL